MPSTSYLDGSRLDSLGGYRLPIIGTILEAILLSIRLNPFNAGPTLNAIHNVTQQKLTYASVGAFLADNVGPSGEMHHKRVCILEDWNETQ